MPEEKKQTYLHGIYGVLYSTEFVRYTPANLSRLDACFAYFSSTITEKALTDNSKIYVTMYLDISVESLLEQYKNMFSNYPAELINHYYVCREEKSTDWGTEYYYRVCEKEDATIGLYTVSLDMSCLNTYLAKYYTSVCIFMCYRLISAGEYYYNSYVNCIKKNKEKKFDLYDIILAMNNKYAEGHKLSLDIINKDFLDILNNVEIINKFFDNKSEVEFYRSATSEFSFEVNKQAPGTKTTAYLCTLLRYKNELTKEK